ncbi:MAG: hypothetical protein J6Q69_03160 [Clostridia bacterium]|nr:hypothetical protein [Clostridia bacterium]
MNAIDSGLIGTDELIRKTGGTLIRNSGKIIAIITAFAAILLTFTNVRLGSITSGDLTGEVAMMLTAAYLMYFSLEDAGEKLGKGTKEYECAYNAYEELRTSIKAEDTEALRDFCIKYAEDELEYRKRSILVGEGLTQKQLQAWLDGEHTDKRASRVFKKITSMKAAALTPQILLSHERKGNRSELSSPERFKLAKMAVGLIPTTVGMCLTVSVILSVKDGLTPESIIEGIIKLAALPIVGFRGYSTGYTHVQECGISWLEAKTRILRVFKSTAASC